MPGVETSCWASAVRTLATTARPFGRNRKRSSAASKAPRGYLLSESFHLVKRFSPSLTTSAVSRDLDFCFCKSGPTFPVGADAPVPCERVTILLLDDSCPWLGPFTLSSRCDPSLAHSFLNECAPMEAFQLWVFPDRMHGRFGPQIGQQRVALLGHLSQSLPPPAGVFTEDHPDIAGQLVAGGKATRVAEKHVGGQGRRGGRTSL